MYTTCRSSDVLYFILHRRYNVYNDGENHFSQFCPRRSLSYIYFEQSELVKGPIGDGILISSFLRYIDDFEKEAIETIMNENAESNINDECLEILLGVFSHCQSNCVPTRQNIGR